MGTPGATKPRHAETIAFYGPVSIYVRKEGREWAAYVDHFSVAGDGSSREAAVRDALRNLDVQLAGLAEEIRTYGSRVQVFIPLPAEAKRGAEVFTTALCAVYRKRINGPATTLRALSRRAAEEMLATSLTVSAVPVPVPA
jgi:hypothetical protein